MNDLRFAFRQLLKNSGFTAVSVLTLAFGIGANTAIFTLVDAFLLRPLPFPNADRLVVMAAVHKQGSSRATSFPNYAQWRDESSVCEEVAAFTSAYFNLTGYDQPERVQGE